MVNIRECSLKDVDNVKIFISKYIRENHILSESDELFNWLYLSGSDINFIIAEVNLNIVAILGFIPNNKFDPKINDLISGSIWAISENAPPGIGVFLIKHLFKTYKPKIYLSLGISLDSEKILSRLGHKTFILNHFVYKSRVGLEYKSKLNLGIDRYSILKIKHNYLPHKSFDFFESKYINNPFYDYKILNIEDTSFVVGRIIQLKYLKIFRIVDFYGAFFDNKKMKSIFNEYIRHNALDYIDFFNFGLDIDILKKSGFEKIVSSENYPHYTEPENGAIVDLKGAVKCDNQAFSKLVINKSDSDQDRPNIIKW